MASGTSFCCSFSRICLVLVCAWIPLGNALPTTYAGVQVTGGGTTYIGTQANGQDVFLGIPYAQPPVGNLRFRKPIPVAPGPTVDAQNYGPRCLQSTMTDDASEDCLTLSIWRPQGVTGPLPVMLWIYGGSFILGEAQSYPGTGIVASSVAMGQPVIYVTFNYRLGFFGFPVGKQAKGRDSANLGLYDQRLAIEWVQNNIQYFGGDPTKVTLFGESAGAISVSYQMLYRGGQIGNAFRAAIMESGAPSSYRSSPQDARARQQAYDQIASQTGCNKKSDSFECLRTLDVNALQAAHVASYELATNLVAFANFPAAYGPVTDASDDFLPAPSSTLVLAGKYANIPIISGNNLDEGTWFVANPQSSLDVVAFLARDDAGLAFALSPIASAPLLVAYPNIPSLGSPYGTGNELFGRAKQYKRAASLVGDLLFTAPRRQFLSKSVLRGQPAWSYLFKQPSGGPPEYGISHASEIAYVFGGLPTDASAGDKDVSSKMMQYWINFATFLNPRPSGSSLPAWPSYGLTKNIIQLKAGDYSIAADSFRSQATSSITANLDVYA
ncbi:Carboxylesterase [Ceratobasidium sp. AG-I]|nr:Carboxylesterase [Ceratobasidium sp. AG-I]